MSVALVNSNRIKPPIAPIGLDYVAEAVNAAGHRVEILDLCWEDDWQAAVDRFFARDHFDLVGLTLRNTDDCMFSSRQSFLGDFAAMIEVVRQQTDALIALGGVGFSAMPEQVMACCQADVGIWGEGEFALVELADRIEERRDWHSLPNLIWRDGDHLRRNPPSAPPLTDLPAMSRTWIDNPRYFREGGQAGFETRRGCPFHCVYCAEPLAKGNRVRLRPAAAVADELEALLAQGIDHLHTCDSEFNVPPEHAVEVCREIVRRGLGDKLRWYAYCSPAPFSPQLAELMRQAGCAGINFGADSGDAEILKRLRRNFTPEDIASSVRWCKEADIVVMLDLLLGSPGETEESLRRTIELMKRIEPERVGVSLGVRIYPGTELAGLVQQRGLKEGLVGGEDPSDPLFFVEPKIAPFADELLEELIGDDRRFFFNPSGPEKNYNYNDNQLLVDAIGEGYRGAYWDILRRCADGSATR